MRRKSDHIDAEIAANIKKHRLGSKTTVRKAAETLGMSEQGYRKLESGETTITVSTIQKLSGLFNIPFTSIVGE